MTETVSIQIINYENETEEEIVELYQKTPYSEEEIFNSFHICICSDYQICYHTEESFAKCKNFDTFIKKHPYIGKIYNKKLEIEFVKEPVRTKVSLMEINRNLSYLSRLNYVMKERKNRGYCKLALYHYCILNSQCLIEKNIAFSIRDTFRTIMTDLEYQDLMKENNINPKIWLNILDQSLKK